MRTLHRTALGPDGASSHHGQQPGLRVLVGEALVGKLVAVDADPPRAVALLAHHKQQRAFTVRFLFNPHRIHDAGRFTFRKSPPCTRTPTNNGQ
jgi:hypothetical protein